MSGPDGPPGVTELDPGASGSVPSRPTTTRAVVAVVLAVLFLAATVVLTRRGIVTDTWPPFLPGADSTSITRYRGPWLTAAAAALLGAGLSVMSAVRSIRARRSPVGAR